MIRLFNKEYGLDALVEGAWCESEENYNFSCFLSWLKQAAIPRISSGHWLSQLAVNGFISSY